MIQEFDTLVENIEFINKNYLVTHFEFVKNPENWFIINAYQEKNNIKKIHFSELKDTDLNHLLDRLFWVDFNKNLDINVEEHLKKHPSYNTDIINNSLFSHRNKQNSSTYSYNYFLNDSCIIEFKISHNYDSSSFQTILNVSHPYSNNFADDERDVIIIKNYKSELFFQEDDFSINKHNLLTIQRILLNDINKCDLTNFDIYNYICAKADDPVNILPHFLKSNYTKEKIMNNFYPDLIENQDQKHSRIFFQFDPIYLHCLAKDLAYSLPWFYIEEDNNNIEIELNDPDFLILHYRLGIYNNNLVLFNDDIDVFTFNNINERYNIKDEIVNYIKADFRRMFRRELHLNKFKDKLEMFFKDTKSISIDIPDPSELSFENMITKEIPVSIYYKDDKIQKILNMEITDIGKESELMVLKEKIKIKQSLNLKRFPEEKNKKRI